MCVQWVVLVEFNNWACMFRGACYVLFMARQSSRTCACIWSAEHLQRSSSLIASHELLRYGVDVDNSKEKKSRHPLSDRNICSTFTTSAVKALPSCHGCEFCLDIKKFEAGYVCRKCFRELTMLNALQKQLRDTKEAIASKGSFRISLTSQANGIECNCMRWAIPSSHTQPEVVEKAFPQFLLHYRTTPQGKTPAEMFGRQTWFTTSSTKGTTNSGITSTSNWGKMEFERTWYWRSSLDVKLSGKTRVATWNCGGKNRSCQLQNSCTWSRTQETYWPVEEKKSRQLWGPKWDWKVFIVPRTGRSGTASDTWSVSPDSTPSCTATTWNREILISSTL